MKFIDLKNKTQKWNSLSRVDTLGSFDFYTTIISFESLQDSHINLISQFGKQTKQGLSQGRKISVEQYQLLSKVFPLAAHEYTHFVDSTSTVWGLRHLHTMNLAYLSNSKYGGREEHFHYAKKFHDHGRGLRLPEYYTVKNNDIPTTTNWQPTITIGVKFTASGEISDKPILFVRFSNDQGVLLARSPVSTVSVLEASAMAQELMVHTSLLRSLDEDCRKVEEKNYSDRTLKYLYNHDITEYSVCVHLVANRTRCKDILIAFHVCAALTRLTLNLPTRAITSILEKNIGEILSLPEDSEFVQKIRSGIKNHDLGMIYYLLCCAIPRETADSPRMITEGIAIALNKLSLTVETLKTWIEEEAKELAVNIINSKIPSLSTLGQAGLRNIKKINVIDAQVPFLSLDLPPALLGDSSTWLPFPGPKNALYNFDLDKCFDELYEGQEWVDRFSEACL